MEVAGLILSLETVLNAISSSIQGFRNVPGAFKELRKVIDLFQQLLSSFEQNVNRHDEFAWVPALKESLEEALETIEDYKKNPLRSRLYSRSYLGKIEIVKRKIHEAVNVTSFTNANLALQARNAIENLSTEIDNLSEENKDFQQSLKQALEENKEEMLQNLAEMMGMSNQYELRQRLIESEERNAEALSALFNKKNFVLERDHAIAIELSRLAVVKMEQCPQEFKCPITLELMESPYSLVQSGYTYEYKALLRALAERPGIDPLTNKQFQGAPQFMENHNLRILIQDWKVRIKTNIKMMQSFRVDTDGTISQYINDSDPDPELDPELDPDPDTKPGPDPDPDPDPDPEPYSAKNIYSKLVKKKKKSIIVALLMIVIVFIVLPLSLKIPSNSSSENPSTKPTQVLSLSPSKNPSTKPTHVLSLSPSEDPSTNPTQVLSLSPSEDPSTKLTHVLSLSPSEDPSTKPTQLSSLPPSNNLIVSWKKILAPDGASGDMFGQRLALSDSLVVVSAYEDFDKSTKGSVYLFTTDGKLEKKITAPNGESSAYFGTSLAVSDNLLVVGKYTDGDNLNGSQNGTAYIYSTNGVHLNKITAFDGAPNDRFAESVAVSNNLIVVGAPFDDDNGSKSGSAYLFRTNGDFIKKITAAENATATDDRTNHRFGRSVAVTDTLVVVSAYWENALRGAVYLFRTNGDFVKKITASDGAPGDRFGGSIAVSNTLIVVGAPTKEYGGSVYLFGTNGDIITNITAPDKASEGFGWKLAVSDTMVVVGVLEDNGRTGSAYLFGTNGDFLKTITAPDAAHDDWFGNFVALSNTLIVVGAPKNDDQGSDSGSAYIFSTSL